MYTSSVYINIMYTMFMPTYRKVYMYTYNCIMIPFKKPCHI